MLRACLVLVALCPGLARADGLKVSGPFWSPLGLLTLEQKGGKVTGKVAWKCPVCPFKRGEAVFEGVLLEDSLAGKVRYCLKGKGCQGDGWAPLVMLVAREGRVLSGAAHFKVDPACQVGGKGAKDGIVMRKVKPKPKEPRPPPGDKSDPGSTPAASPDAGTETARVDAGSEVVPPPDPGAEPMADGQGQAMVAEVEPEDPGRFVQNEGTWKSNMETGAGHLETGQFERARKAFLAAIELDPTRPEAHNGVGVTYYARHDHDMALEWYKKALEVDANFSDAYYNMACIYALQRKPNIAFRYLKIAALNGFVQPDVLESDEDLASVRSDPRYKEILKQMRKPSR
jgi:hypothetical protein